MRCINIAGTRPTYKATPLYWGKCNGKGDRWEMNLKYGGRDDKGKRRWVRKRMSGNVTEQINH